METRVGWPGRGESGVCGDESELAEVWAQQAFERSGLRTTSGLAFQVVYPGFRTGGAGPDFREAILAQRDGTLLRGDVEIHLQSSGWYQHGHDADPAYERVLLHVVLVDDRPVRNAAGEAVLTLELAGRVGPKGIARTAEMAAGYDDADPEQLSYVVAPCRKVLPKLGSEETARRLQGLALQRFRAKQAVFEGELAVFEPEQALYAALLEALGYSRNRQPFRQLAQVVPFAAIEVAPLAPEIERLLLAGSSADGACPERAQLRRFGLTGETVAAPWQTVGVRPENLPVRRIAQFAAVLGRLVPEGLIDQLLAPLFDLDGPAPKSVCVLGRTWRSHLRELGLQRADAIAVNVLLPFAAAYGQATCQFLLSELAVQAFLSYPPEGSNHVTRYMRREILGPLAGTAAGAAGEQALIQVWDRWCHQKVCAVCPLGAKKLS